MLQLFTIGHGSQTAEAFLALLQQHGITCITDIRSVPYSSYHPQFRQINLKTFLHQHHINYVYFGDSLGGRPKDESCYTNGKVDYRKVSATSFFKQGIEQLKNACAKNDKIAILCSESKPSACHRTHLVAENLHPSVRVIHILRDGKFITHEALMQQLHQPNLFG